MGYNIKYEIEVRLSVFEDSLKYLERVVILAGILREIGRVVEISGPMAKVIIARHSSCENCGACGMGSKPEIDFLLQNDIGAQVGDRVVIEMRSKALLKAALLVYTIPLAALITGFIIGQSIGKSRGMGPDQAEFAGMGIGFFFLVLSFLVLRWFDRLRGLGSKLQPQLVKVVGSEESFF